MTDNPKVMKQTLLEWRDAEMLKQGQWVVYHFYPDFSSAALYIGVLNKTIVLGGTRSHSHIPFVGISDEYLQFSLLDTQLNHYGIGHSPEAYATARQAIADAYAIYKAKCQTDALTTGNVGERV